MLQRFKEYSYLLMHINGDIDTAELFAELYKDKLKAVYDTKVESVVPEDMAELVAERQMVRADETERARAELLVKYGEVFKDRILEKAVEKVDCELEGKVYVEKKQIINRQEGTKLISEEKAR